MACFLTPKKKKKKMLITTRQKRIRLHEDLFNLTYNDINLQLTTGDKILGVNVDQNLQGLIIFNTFVKRFHHISGFYQRYIRI